MDVETIEGLLAKHPSWRLLRARNAPLILSFLGGYFVEGHSGAAPAGQLAGALEEHLDSLERSGGGDRFRKDAESYLEDWAAPESGWLRRFRPLGSDEVHYDATAAVEKACAFVEGLTARAFVGTESRLHTVVELLRQIAHGAEEDPETRLAELRRRREALDREIDDVERGHVAVLDGASLRDRYQLFASTARELLSDFREVEENFRGLDRAARERIATWDGSKGELLGSLVGDRTDIAASDQGRSFQAFFDFLLSQARQDELSELLARVQSLGAIDSDRRLHRVHHDWFDAAERTQQTVRQLSEQLRRFLDDQIWLENRRVLDLTRSIEAHAVALRDQPPRTGLELEAPSVGIALPFERPLYEVKPAVDLDSALESEDPEELDASALFDQTFVDQARLADQIRSVVPARSAALLSDIVELYPLGQGVAELVGYLALTDEDLELVTDEGEEMRVGYRDRDDRPRVVRLPTVMVHRR